MVEMIHFLSLLLQKCINQHQLSFRFCANCATKLKAHETQFKCKIYKSNHPNIFYGFVNIT